MINKYYRTKVDIRDKQQGFAPLLIISALLLIVVVGFTVYRIVGNGDSDISNSTSDSGNSTNANNIAQDSLQNTTSAEDIDSDEPSASNSNSDSTAESVPTNSTSSGGSSDGGTSSGSSDGGTSGGGSSDSSDSVQTKTFNIDSFNFGYSMGTMNVSPGDVVTVNLANSGGNHDWVVSEISGAATKIISSGQTDSITFTVPQSAAGKTYNFFCSVGNHRAQGMEGNFVVSS